MSEVTSELLLGCYGGFRKDTWSTAFDLIRRSKAKALIETGCFRGTGEDGLSTLLLAQMAKEAGGKLDSYELNPENIKLSMAVLRELGLQDYVRFHQGDSVLNLARRTEPIDFAYLDSFDCGLGPDYGPCQRHQLAELETILGLFRPNASILLDDHIPETGGKTKLSIQRLEQLKWKQEKAGYQVLYSTEQADQWKPHRFAVLCGHLHEYAPLAVSTLYHNRAQYCLRHGYDLQIWRQVHSCFQDPRSHATGYSWSRLYRLLELLESGKYEWVWVVGADTLVTNFTVRLEDLVILAETEEAKALPLPKWEPHPSLPNKVIHWLRPADHLMSGPKHLIICGERFGSLQADSFLVRNSPEGIAYVKDLLHQHHLYKHHPWVENQTMMDLREKHGAITCILPQFRMNSYDYRRFYHLDPAYRDGTDCYGNRGQWQDGDFLIHWPAAKLIERLQWCKEYEQKVVR